MTVITIITVLLIVVGTFGLLLAFTDIIQSVKDAHKDLPIDALIDRAFKRLWIGVTCNVVGLLSLIIMIVSSYR